VTPHVEFETLAACAEGTLAPEEAERVRGHLQQCRSCMAAYADAVRYRAAWLADPDAFRAQDDELRLAARHGPPPHATPPRRRWPRALTRPLQVAAAAIAVTALFLSRASDAPSLRFQLPPEVRAASERSSGRGLVLPGAGRGADRFEPELRSGQHAISPALGREVEVLIDRYERGTPNPDAAARVVAGLLAVGEIDAANDYAREALRRSDHHVPLLVLASDARYRSNDLEGAEALLRTASARAPRDPVVALDRALVLRQLGREDQARPLLMEVAGNRATSLAARARRELTPSVE
jgi:tetratricopeptide (TPR) repeat protein